MYTMKFMVSYPLTNALCPQPLLAWTETWLCLKEIAFPEAFSSGGCFLSHGL